MALRATKGNEPPVGRASGPQPASGRLSPSRFFNGAVSRGSGKVISHQCLSDRSVLGLKSSVADGEVW